MRYFSVYSYIILIVVVNVGFSYLPGIHLGLSEISYADFLVGWVYLARDFAQREVGHYVILAMIVGSLLSFVLSDPTIAYASVIAFTVGELIDWLVFTVTRKPLSQRLLWSASLSAPLDTYVFLQLIHRFNWPEFALMTAVKCLGVFGLWWSWRIKETVVIRAKTA